MNWNWLRIVVLYLIGALGLFARVALAQGVNIYPTATPATPTTGEPGSAMLMLGFLAMTTVVLVAIVKVNEFRQKREDEAIGLQVRIDDALLAVPGLLCTSVAPTVRIPFRKSAPARIKLSGEAPSPYLEQKALQVTAQVASRFWPNFTIENHMVIAPSAGARAAGAVAPARAELVGAKGERTWLPAASHLRS